jgi:polyhydroxyalkanoate synthesis regulator phasin
VFTAAADGYMSSAQSPAETGSLAFFAAWLLFHEKADDWIRDALRRARETPEDLRHEYQRFLISVEREKEALKGILSEAFANEIRELGFLHRNDTSDLRAEVEDLRARLRGLEEKLERFVAGDES